ncbi:MAG: ATP-binding protein [Chloroflexota bacterium]
MRITKLRLSDFKRHARLEIEPAAGLTIIRGPNEAGKSTIQTALELGLFRKADSMARDVQALRRWGSLEPPLVEIDFEADGESGRLRKRFAGQHAAAELAYGERSSTDNTFIEERIGAFTGIPSEAFFRATASVGHAELSEVGGDEPAIQDRLQKAISGADRGTAAAKKKLATAVHRYKTEGHKNPGLLKVIREESEMLEGELVGAEQALARLEADRAQWAEAHQRREGLDIQLTRQQESLAEARRAELLASESAATEDRYQRLRRASQLVDQENEVRRSSPTEMPLPALRAGVARASSLDLDLSELDAELSIDSESDVAIDAGAKPPRAWRWVAIAVVVALAAGLAWMVLGGLVGAIALLGLAILTAVALVQAIRVALRARQYGLARELAVSATTHRHEADHERQESFRRKRREFEQQLAALGVANVAQAQQLLTVAESHSEELARIDGELRGLGIAERSARRLEAERDQAANEAERAKHALADTGTLAEDPASARRAAQKQVERTTPARDEARSLEDQALGRVDANTVDAELVASMAERLVMARERQAEMERRMSIYQATLAAIEEAERATLKTAARYLEERMGPAIARISDGRYDEIEVDERDLAFKVRVPETGELVDVQELSRGTADQLFLTARLGLIRLVTMDRRPPLILDDAFVTFDAARGERALRLVKEVAADQGFQVFYLTCSDRFDALADELVVLDGPPSGAARATMSPPMGTPQAPLEVDTRSEASG